MCQLSEKCFQKRYMPEKIVFCIILSGRFGIAYGKFGIAYGRLGIA